MTDEYGLPEDEDPELSFDVTVSAIVGHVSVSRYGGGISPIMAAFQIIADQDMPGKFSFPMGHGWMQHVTIERENLHP